MRNAGSAPTPIPDELDVLGPRIGTACSRDPARKAQIALAQALQLGGTRAWLRFFADHPLALGSLDQMGALPENVLPIRQAATDGADRDMR